MFIVKAINLDYEFVNFDQIDNIKNKENSGIYIVNPNGVNVEFDVRPYIKDSG